MSRPQTRDDNDDLDIEDALGPLPPEGPRTEAGKALLREWLMLRPDHPPNTARVRDTIIAIEREAASPAPLDVERLAEILAEYEGFPGTPSLKNRAMAEYIVARLSRAAVVAEDIRLAAQEAEE